MAQGDQQQFCLRWNDFQTNMVSSFKHLRDEKSFTDVTLACDGQTCKAHKMVLSACSPYFKVKKFFFSRILKSFEFCTIDISGFVGGESREAPDHYFEGRSVPTLDSHFGIHVRRRSQRCPRSTPRIFKDRRTT